MNGKTNIINPPEGAVGGGIIKYTKVYENTVTANEDSLSGTFTGWSDEYTSKVYYIQIIKVDNTTSYRDNTLADCYATVVNTFNIYIGKSIICYASVINKYGDITQPYWSNDNSRGNFTVNISNNGYFSVDVYSSLDTGIEGQYKITIYRMEK